MDDSSAIEMMTVPVIMQGDMPEQKSERAAGFDLWTAKMVEIKPGRVEAIPTGLRVAIPAGFFGKIEARSGTALKGLVTHAGLIDSDYRGEIKILMQNVTTAPMRVDPQTRIAQLLLLPSIEAEMVQQKMLPPTSRGERGFGSTGEKQETAESQRK